MEHNRPFGIGLRGVIAVFANDSARLALGTMNALKVGMTYDKLNILSIATECRRIVLAAESDLGPLPKASYLDLVADNIEDVPLETLRAALVVAGVGY